MNKFYIIKDVLSISNYAKKYKVNYRKIYRYLADEIIEHYLIDGIAFLPDKDITLLIKDQRGSSLVSSVKTLTLETISVKNLTLSVESVDNEEVDNVKILTLEQKDILETPDVKLNGAKLDKKYKLLNLIEMIKRI